MQQSFRQDEWHRAARAGRRTFAMCGVLIVVAATRASGQSVGLEVGFAGIENYDPVTPAFGVSAQLPVWRRFSASASYARWTGRDGNADIYPEIFDTPYGGYGNQAFLLGGLVRVLGAGKPSVSLGAGLGWFQQYTVEGERRVARYDRTPVGTLLVRYPVGQRLAPYLRADVQIPNGAYLRYGLFKFGIDVQLR